MPIYNFSKHAQIIVFSGFCLFLGASLLHNSSLPLQRGLPSAACLCGIAFPGFQKILFWSPFPTRFRRKGPWEAHFLQPWHAWKALLDLAGCGIPSEGWASSPSAVTPATPGAVLCSHSSGPRCIYSSPLRAVYLLYFFFVLFFLEWWPSFYNSAYFCSIGLKALHLISILLVLTL